MTRQLLFVDDEPHVLDSFRRTLSDHDDAWDLAFVDSPLVAWERIVEEPVDLVVSDFNMPGMNGLELLGRMKRREETKDVPFVLVTGQGDRTLRRQALDLGATDLLEKPVDADDLTARIRNALRIKSFQEELTSQNAFLEQRVRERTVDLENSRLEMVRRLAKAAEFRDEETGNHVIRVGLYSRVVAGSLGMDREFVETMGLTAPLHDIGKIGIPDAILLKPGKLTDDERTIMQGHCLIGARILSEEGHVGLPMQPDDVWFQQVMCASNRESLRIAACIALTHHEKWDGSGYPRGLESNEIPLEGRITAICDVFDALISRRPYKREFTEEETLAILAEGSGKHFDPQIHAAFLRSIDQIRSIRAEFSDEPALIS